MSSDQTSEARLTRYPVWDRVSHWVVAMGFFLAGLSGLALFHPGPFWLTMLFGGGPWTRILHPFFGVVMALVFASLAVRFWHHNLLEKHDWQWMKQIQDVLTNREDRLPEIGRYNAGQKLVFWLMVVCLGVLLITGIVFWRPWFALYFPIPLIRVAALLHATAAAALIIGILTHIYAAIWVKGTTGAMLEGTVSAKWARKHHALWYREMTKKA